MSSDCHSFQAVSHIAFHPVRKVENNPFSAFDRRISHFVSRHSQPSAGQGEPGQGQKCPVFRQSSDCGEIESVLDHFEGTDTWSSANEPDIFFLIDQFVLLEYDILASKIETAVGPVLPENEPVAQDVIPFDSGQGIAIHELINCQIVPEYDVAHGREFQVAIFLGRIKDAVLDEHLVRQRISDNRKQADIGLARVLVEPTVADQDLIA